MPKHSITVAEVMSRRPITLRPETSIYKAVETLLDKAISGAPVVDGGGDLVGVLSEKDCMKVLTESAFNDLPAGVTVGDLMSKNPETIQADSPVIHAAEFFVSNHYRRLPVLDDGGALVGQLSRRDVLKAIQLMAAPEKRGDRYLTAKQDPSQAGSLISDKGKRDTPVGPESNKRFQ